MIIKAVKFDKKTYDEIEIYCKEKNKTFDDLICYVLNKYLINENETSKDTEKEMSVKCH